ncbi:MAG: AAA family ATPase [Byssovorax sp.]
MRLNFPIGFDDFRTLREQQLEYVDKSHLIRELLDRPGVEATLLPRPRRFGKTLNLSLLRYYFEKSEQDLSHLFDTLSIWQAGDAYRAHFQRYPVIHLSFKETNFESFDRVLGTLKKKIQVLFDEHRYLLLSDRLSDRERAGYAAILDGSAEQALHDRALLDLSAYLHAYHGEKVIILIDEYDEPIHAGHLHGYAPCILDFLRAFLGGGLKGNVHLFKAVVTGILRVARESLFSGLNNLGVYTLLDTQYNTCFGFTEAEVTALLERTGRADRLDEVRTWYNGYLFGGEVIYNPWSVLSFLDRGDESPKPYWLSTSSNDLVHEVVAHNAIRLQPMFESLLEGGGIERVLDENVVLSEVRDSEDALWSLLVFSGYLKAEKRSRGPMEQAAHLLSIPNREVRLVYATTFRRWMTTRMEGHGGSLDLLTQALLSGDAEGLEDQLQAFVSNLLSYHDPGTVNPERVYQGFIVGLLAVLEPAYQVRSNRESGQGRPDVMIRPMRPGKPGVVMELKVARPRRKTLAQALSEGIEQLQENEYGAELRAAGAPDVHAFAVAFDGKKVRVASPRKAKKPRSGKKAGSIKRRE